MEDSVSKSLKQKKIESLLISGGCTKHVQAPEISRNKPFKAKVLEEYDYGYPQMELKTWQTLEI